MRTQVPIYVCWKNFYRQISINGHNMNLECSVLFVSPSVCLSVSCMLVSPYLSLSLSLSLSHTHTHKHTHISLFLALGFNFYLYYMRLSIYYMFNVTRTNIFIKPQLKRTFKIIKTAKNINLWISYVLKPTL